MTRLRTAYLVTACLLMLPSPDSFAKTYMRPPRRATTSVSSQAESQSQERFRKFVECGDKTGVKTKQKEFRSCIGESFVSEFAEGAGFQYQSFFILFKEVSEGYICEKDLIENYKWQGNVFDTALCFDAYFPAFTKKGAVLLRSEKGDMKIVRIKI